MPSRRLDPALAAGPMLLDASGALTQALPASMLPRAQAESANARSTLDTDADHAPISAQDKTCE